MAFVKIWVHFVWTTKKRQPFLKKIVKEKLIDHIKENAISKYIYVDSIDGGMEHLHALISLGSNQSAADVARLLKGESSHWVNDNDLVQGQFEWQDEYFAVSVSESVVPKVRNYINTQPARLSQSGGEEHHRVKPFSEEYDEFMRKYGFHK